jgi:DNA-binding NarL/FixJ family response regulator
MANVSSDRNQSIPPVRALLVDDFEPFRRFVRSTLGTRPGLQVIGEASDGLDAVQQAAELRPDLVLLDIGLPKQNGIEAALQIRKLAPEAKIIFVSQESSLEVLQKAFSLGALGYVVKTRAGKELLAAVETVICEREWPVGAHLLSGIPVDKNQGSPS